MLYSIHSTIAYELMTLEFPYKHLPLECLIFRAGCGETQSLELISNRHFRTTISKCWNPIPQHRPSFKDLVTSLEQNVREEICTQYTACCYTLSILYSLLLHLSILYSLLLHSQYTIQLVVTSQYTVQLGVTLSVYYTACCYISVYCTACCYTLSILYSLLLHLSILYSLLLHSQYTIRTQSVISLFSILIISMHIYVPYSIQVLYIHALLKNRTRRHIYMFEIYKTYSSIHISPSVCI